MALTLSQTFCSVMHTAEAIMVWKMDNIASSRDAAAMRALHFIGEVMLMNILLAWGWCVVSKTDDYSHGPGRIS